jgi:hypothetical protein
MRLKTNSFSGKRGSRKVKKRRTRDFFFVEKHKSVLRKVPSTDINNYTALGPIDLLSQINKENNVERY